MYLHVGERKITGTDEVMGIFNSETLRKSELNNAYLDEEKKDTKSIIIDIHDEVIVSKISSVTLLSRLAAEEDGIIWTRSKE